MTSGKVIGCKIEAYHNGVSLRLDYPFFVNIGDQVAISIKNDNMRFSHRGIIREIRNIETSSDQRKVRDVVVSRYCREQTHSE